MAPPADLRKIGMEGFALIDKYYGPPRKSSSAIDEAFPGRQGRWVMQGRSDEIEEPNSIINSREAASRHGGIMVLTYTTKGRWSRPPNA